MTRTALKEPLKYDKTGAYKDMSKSNGIKHLASIEKGGVFWGAGEDDHRGSGYGSDRAQEVHRGPKVVPGSVGVGNGVWTN